MRRIVSKARRAEYLHEHIPYRLQAIDSLAWFCEAILAGKVPPKRLAVSVDGAVVPWVAVTNALVDAGLTHGRAMMEFLGISRNRHGKLMPAKRDPTRDDLWPEDFGLKSIPIAVALRLGQGHPNEVRAALVRLHATASKGVAHLTTGSNPADVEYLFRATKAVRRITEEHVYLALGIALPLRKLRSPFR